MHINYLHKTDDSQNSRNNSPFFQPKPASPVGRLNVSQPNDVYEHEADAVADKVMPMSDEQVIQQSFIKPPITNIQRKCADCEEEEKQMHRKETRNSSIKLAASPENYINSLTGRGKALSQDEKSFFEPRFGNDFSNVRVHTGSEANKSANNINALAYTQGNNIVFADGQYQPNTTSGKKLLAHELTHVVQQNSLVNTQIVQRTDAPSSWCAAFMELIRYEDANGKLWVMYEYNSLSVGIFGEEKLTPLNHDIPSIYGDVDIDWMFRLAIIQYPFILANLFSPTQDVGSELVASYIGYMGAKAYWNTVRAPYAKWQWEYGSIFEEANWNSAWAIVDWIHHDKSLREIFAPAVQICESQGY